MSSSSSSPCTPGIATTSNAYKVAPGLSQVPSTASTISYSLNTDLLSLSLEFTDLVSTIEALPSSSTLGGFTREEVKDELPYLHNKVMSFVRRSLHDDKPSTDAIDRYDRIVSSVNEQVRRKASKRRRQDEEDEEERGLCSLMCVGPLCSHICAGPTLFTRVWL